MHPGAGNWSRAPLNSIPTWSGSFLREKGSVFRVTRSVSNMWTVFTETTT